MERSALWVVSVLGLAFLMMGSGRPDARATATVVSHPTSALALKELVLCDNTHGEYQDDEHSEPEERSRCRQDEGDHDPLPIHVRGAGA